jgi:hypothetical protein
MVDDKDLLAKEMQSWNSFKYALREKMRFYLSCYKVIR